MNQHPRSYLFVPGQRADRFAKAAESGAHRIIIDLEDAVAPADKDLARANAVTWFQQGGCGVIRINSADSFWFDADLAAVAGCRNAEIMVPKASAASLTNVTHYLVTTPLIGLIESVEGVVELHDITAVKNVTRLAFGNLDFGTDSGMSAGHYLDTARFQISLVSRHAKLLPPIDGVTVELDNEGALQEDLVRAKGFGFSAKLCIHPKQVDAVNYAFMPSEAEKLWARAVMDAANASGGAVIQMDGKMVDKPVIDRARSILLET
jgi:citrate lyase subunit beta/citryl-CoA lyase